MAKPKQGEKATETERKLLADVAQLAYLLKLDPTRVRAIQGVDVLATGVRQAVIDVFAARMDEKWQAGWDRVANASVSGEEKQ